MAPFLNQLEQNNAEAAAVCEQVATAKYAYLYAVVFGTIDCSPAGAMDSYENIARAIAAYEASSEVNQFSSKYDASLAGQAELTTEEKQGLALFNGKAGCAGCHPSTPGPYSDHPLFTDFTYDNLGVPRNPDNPFYHEPDFNPVTPPSDWVDLGLGGFLESGSSDLVVDHPAWVAMASDNYGRQKVPTLRNVAKIQGGNAPKAYMHNGYFKSLWAVVHFYNTRDTKDTCPDEFTTEKDALAMDCWPEPEYAQTVNTEELGDLGLTSEEEDAIVAFLKTLSDGYFDPTQ
jgi:cytochrome c peroxidase